jgi:UDP-glucose 4-epimerase
MARILVTGGCGYIGSHTLVDLIDHGYEVISIDNFVRSDPSMFEGIKKITGRNVLNLELDLADTQAVLCLGEHLKHVDGIIHFAAYKSVPESVANPLMYYQNNIQSLINLLELAEEAGVAHFVFSSSCSVYGDARELPVFETTPFGRAESPYGRSKQIGENIIEDYIRSGTKMNAVMLRYFNPVGAHPSAEIGEMPIDVPNNLVPYITQTAAGIRKELTVFGDDYNTRDGSCIRDYVHVMDIAAAHTRAFEKMMAEKRTSTCEIYNLGTGKGVTVLEMIQAFKDANGVDLNYKIGPRRAGDVEAIYADNTKARKELGWEIQNDLQEMMRSAWEWEKKLRIKK